MRRRALLALAALGIGACGSSASPPSTGPVKRSPASKVVVVVMENEERSSVIGSPHALQKHLVGLNAQREAKRAIAVIWVEPVVSCLQRQPGSHTHRLVSGT
jgi:hypothetical protein